MGHREVPRRCCRRVPRLRRCPTAPPRRSRSRRATTSACTARRTAASTSAPRRSSAASRARPSRSSPTCIEAHGSTRLRTTPHQKLVILDIPEDRVESLIAGLDELGLSARPSLIRRGTIACTGIEFCKLAIVETKAYATDAVLDLEERLARHRPAASDQPARQRLPQLVRAHPDRRHRPQGPARHDRRRAGARLPGAPRRRARDRRPRGGRPRPHRARPQGHRRRHRRLRRAGRQAASSTTAMPQPTRPSPSGRTAPTRRPCDERLPRTPRRDPAHRTTSCARSPRRATPSSAASPTTRHPPPRSSRGSPRNFGTDAAAVACSMADAVLPHLVAEQLPGVDVLFLDTGYHFAETRVTRDEVGRALDVRIVDVLPEQTVAEQDAEFGAAAVLPRPRPVLRAPQGRAPAGRARRLRGVVHRRAPRGGADPHEHAARHVGRAQRPRQGQPGRGVDASTTCSTTPARTRCP